MRQFLLLCSLFVAGCAERPEPLAEPPKEPQATTAPQPSGGGDGIAVISPAAGPSSPVTGNAVGGEGSNIGTEMKKRAKGVAEKQPDYSEGE